MRKLLTICAAFATFSILALACDQGGGWSGRLYEECYKNPHHVCTAKAEPARYLLVANGQTYRFTMGSNDMIYLAMKSRKEDHTLPRSGGPVWARVKGTLNDDGHINLQEIDVH